jgi:sulfoxide reductase heme-binding subunit YedZ
VSFLRGRAGTHLALFTITAIACLVLLALRPEAHVAENLTDSLGYLSLTLIAVTLLIGPLQLRHRRRNPVNIYLRRDTGIWAAIAGVLHVYFGLQVHLGGQIPLYFFTVDEDEYTPLFDAFGMSNWIGLGATVLLVILLLISNDLMLRVMRGPLWKWVQRLNYLLAIMVLLHTVGYQIVLHRAPPLQLLLLAITAAAIVAQVYGVLRYSSRPVRS